MAKKLYVEIESGEESYIFTKEEAIQLINEEYKVIQDSKEDNKGCPLEIDFKWMEEEDYREMRDTPDHPCGPIKP